MGDSSLDFELRCFTDVDNTLSTRSDLLFAILKRLREERIDIPMPKRPQELLGGVHAMARAEDLDHDPEPSVSGRKGRKA
jgi:small-conductance mechanosensitive channel